MGNKIDGISFMPFANTEYLYENNLIYIVYSVLRGNLFYLLVFLYMLFTKSIKREQLLLYSFVIISFVEFLLLSEKGRVSHMNLSWGYINAKYLLFVFSSKWIFESVKNNKQELLKKLCIVVLIMHVICGVYAHLKYADIFRNELHIKNTTNQQIIEKKIFDNVRYNM